MRTRFGSGVVCLSGLAAVLWVTDGAAQQAPELPTPRQLWERLQQEMPPFSYKVDKDEVVTSDTDPRQQLRRLEISFRSQTVGVFRRRMDHKAVIYMPADPKRNQAPERRGNVVVVGQRYGEEYMVHSYGEPIAARTGYPTMVIPVPGEYGGHDGESAWIYFLDSQLRQTNDPADHNYFRLAIPYIRALDVFAGILGEKKIRAVIGGHSKRATSAFTAAAMDPERIAGIVYMGNESTWDPEETKNPMRAVWPINTSRHVTAETIYLGATNEGGYQMFNINKIVAGMQRPWTISYIPNYRHDSDSEIQYMDWQMWVSHVFDGRPISCIEDLNHEEDAEGTFFRARVTSPNKIIQVRAWYVYSDDEYWRDLMWYPADAQARRGVPVLRRGQVAGRVAGRGPRHRERVPGLREQPAAGHHAQADQAALRRRHVP
jgi:pimeloyl-ACP methyl ester carboxylesterase